MLEREIAAAHGTPTIGVVHRLLACDRPVSLELTPLCTWRNVHGERHADGAPDLELGRNRVRLRAGLPGRRSRLAGRRRVVPRRSRPRGSGARPRRPRGSLGRRHFRVELAAGASHEVTAAALPLAARPPRAENIVAAARERARELIRASGAENEIDAQLVLAADQFTITTGGRPTAVAGYPWFGEWSRDLMTSYEGLYLATNRHDEGREVLLTSAATVSEGMLANTADTGSLEYNTVDGTLWFVHAVGRHVAVTGDDDLGNELAPVLEQIVDHHLEGTRFGISVDPGDGLLRQGAEGWALTWMDARIDGVPVTPRAGKPVEVNALWLRALDVAAALAGGDDRFALAARAGSVVVRRALRAPDGAGLLDVVDGPDGDDASVRPNQLLAVSLPNGPLDDATAAPRRRRLQPEPPHPARAALARPRRSALPALPSRQLRRARRRLPPGHRVALASRAVRRRRSARGRPARGHPRRHRGPPRRMGPRLGLGDRRRGRAARLRPAALSRPGRSPRCFVSAATCPRRPASDRRRAPAPDPCLDTRDPPVDSEGVAPRSPNCHRNRLTAEYRIAPVNRPQADWGERGGGQ